MQSFKEHLAERGSSDTCKRVDEDRLDEAFQNTHAGNSEAILGKSTTKKGAGDVVAFGSLRDMKKKKKDMQKKEPSMVFTIFTSKPGVKV